MLNSTFSVIVPIHNRAQLISTCVDSILAQSFTDFELILVDNNSTDDLAGALAEYDDDRIRLVKCKTPGPSAARMEGISTSAGRYLSFIDSDDIWLDDVLASAHKELESDRKPLAVYIAPVRFHSGSPVPWDQETGTMDCVAENFLDAVLLGAPGACGLAGVRRELFENGAGFDEKLWIGEDLDWALRKASLGPVSMLRSKPRLGYRWHQQNITKDGKRYETWALQLLGFVKSGRYEVSENASLRRYIVMHLIGQLQTLLRMRKFTCFVKIYPKVFFLGLRWGVISPLWMPSLFKSYFTTLLGMKPRSVMQ